MQRTIYKATDHDIDHTLIDRDALYVIDRLRQAGYSAYLVGGSVRDLLLKRVPKDFDISTSAWPEQVKKVFQRQCILIGRRFRLAHIRFGHKVIEVATFRSGFNESDLIVQDNVWGTEEEDVLRRDFTINGLFYDPVTHSVIDYVGGWNDIHSHTIRTIGDAETRFKQDPVRMIRMVKFQARFAFIPDEGTYKALINCRNEIVKSSPARVLEEMLRMLESCASAPFFQKLHDAQLLEFLFPEIAKILSTPRGEEIQEFLLVADQINRKSARFPIERPVLVASLLYPLLEEEIKRNYLEQGRLPHLGEIIAAIGGLIKAFILSSFSHFPRRMSAITSYVLSTQYRLTPLKSKRTHLIRLFRMREFPLALRLLKIRATVHPELQETYIHVRESYRHFLRSEEHKPRHAHSPTLLEDEKPMSYSAELLDSPSALPIYHMGPPLKVGPLPALFYFALSGKDSLELDPFNQPAAFLKEDPMRVFSFTLPGHGGELKNSEAIAYWAEAFASGQNPIRDFVEQAKANIDELVQRNLIDPQRLAAAGLSRGGFVATHLAAQDERVKIILGFAPMVSLELSEEFKKEPVSASVIESSLEALIPRLTSKMLRFYIGNRDLRVHTDACYSFIRKLTDAAYVAKVSSPQVELVISPSIGHLGHGTAPQTFLNGMNWLKEKMRIL